MIPTQPVLPLNPATWQMAEAYMQARHPELMCVRADRRQLAVMVLLRLHRQMTRMTYAERSALIGVVVGLLFDVSTCLLREQRNLLDQPLSQLLQSLCMR